MDIVFGKYNRREDNRRLIVIFGHIALYVCHISDHAAVLQDAHQVQQMTGWADKWVTYCGDEYGDEYTGGPGRGKPSAVIDVRKRTEKGFD